jgi:hypothetical protein
MKILNHPILKTALVVVGVIIVLGIARPYTAKLPVVGKYL